MKNGSRLAELQEERALARQDLVAGADARENAVNRTEAAAFGRNVASLRR